MHSQVDWKNIKFNKFKSIYICLTQSTHSRNLLDFILLSS